mmetsp:Transcript_2399/g.3334  ORF Transcript_2399/g.3334 Transcript_2399/m.3334 type:complete len:211 (+) Transcript_2399:176-808(+)|eukprot:CAMPEP_0116062068 /NCGR_PEP_ID=MMETSP0322-20121206/7502_1 /TAXON_ID=163516 /ORGANISM="Leptocylindrus danicus var. apora, Strain B651" /LENGTH=210 /DNA_ID=CAMNT_0003547231 /DNA_START=177 /DNA_END=809 /DNA_ORIENTATION=-
MSGMEENDETVFKIVLVGDSGVGKSNILNRFVHNKFEHDMKATVGVEFYSTKVTIENGTQVGLRLWDTAGQERYRAITKSYYRGSVGAIIVYDITNRVSFSHVEMWLEEVKQNTDSNCQIILVGNKSDLSDERQVFAREGKIFARDKNVLLLEVSALDSSGIETLFQQISQMVYEKDCEGRENGTATDLPDKTNSRVLEQTSTGYGYGCC